MVCKILKYEKLLSNNDNLRIIYVEKDALKMFTSYYERSFFSYEIFLLLFVDLNF